VLRRYWSLLLLTLVLPPIVSAQLTMDPKPMPDMNHSQTKMISGKDHPELIPDLTAYRLFFIANGELPNPSEVRKARQEAFLGKIGADGADHKALVQTDHQALVQTLDDFKVKFTAMVDEYNARVEAAVKTGGSLPDQEEFLKQRDRLVQLTRDRLKLDLSADGMSKLDAHVQHEKSRMQIAAKEGQ
jgi:hypothetical protein